MKIVLPPRERMCETTAADPLKFYYIPVARSFYLARFADAIRLLPGSIGNLLEVGCGSGIFLPELARRCERLFACDIHANLAAVDEMLSGQGVRAEIAQGSACDLPYTDKSMDAVVCMSVLEHIRELDHAAREFLRVLRPGGVVVIGVPVKNLVTEAILRTSYLSLPDARLDDEHVSTHRDVLETFGKSFAVERIRHIPRLLPEALRLYTSARFSKFRTEGTTTGWPLVSVERGDGAQIG